MLPSARPAKGVPPAHGARTHSRPKLTMQLRTRFLALQAHLETCHAYWAWRPKRLDWWIVFVNLLGCVFFMTAGLLAYVPKGAEPAWIGAAANVHLALGALGFLIGAVLMMVESAQAARGRRVEAA